jgi:multiple sugar transport system ATP-binding protein
MPCAPSSSSGSTRAPPRELYHRPANLFVAAFIGSPAMNLLTASLGGTADRPTVSFAGHALAVDPRALERYPGLSERIGSEVIVGLRPEHFVMDGDAELPDEQKLTLWVELAEAMGAEVHIHATVAVAPVEIEGGAVAAEDQQNDLDASAFTTKVIARVDGIHTVHSDEDVRLGVKTHLAHFFDPATGDPLR